MKYLKGFILAIEAIVELVVLFAMALLMVEFIRENSAEDIAYGGVFGTALVYYLAITITGFIRLYNNKKTIIITGLGMKMAIFAFALCAVAFPIDRPYLNVIGYFVFMLIITSVIMRCFENNEEEPVKKRPVYNNVKYEKSRFTSFKAKWVWDTAASEYSRMTGKAIEEFDDSDNDKVYDYAAMPMTYFVIWLIKRKLYSQAFEQDHGKELLDDVANRRVNPVDFMRHNLDYTVTKDDFSREMQDFADDYLETTWGNITGDLSKVKIKKVCYENDYFFAILNIRNRTYCYDFDWGIYEKIEKQLDKRYQYYRVYADVIDEDIYENHYAIEDIFKRTGAKVDLWLEPDVNEDYARRCMDHFVNLDENIITKLRTQLAEIYKGYLDEDDHTFDNNDTFLASLYNFGVEVYKPYGDEVAYVVRCGASFEEEHGLGFVIRGDKLLESAYSMDVDSPWCYENEYNYELLCETAGYDFKSIVEYDDAEKLIDSGKFKEAIVEDMQVIIIPATANERLRRSCEDINYFIKAGYADRMIEEPVYKGDSVIPCKIKVEGKHGDKTVYLDIINIW